jgi:tetratricopeptide (TPR) repeat protein
MSVSHDDLCPCGSDRKYKECCLPTGGSTGSALGSKPNASQIFSYAEALRKAGKVNQAVAAYQKAIAAKPDFALAYMNLGGVFLSENEYDKAIESLKRAMELDSSLTSVLTNLALAYNQLGKFDQSETLLRKQLITNPRHPEALLMLASIKGKNLPEKELVTMEEMVNDPSVLPEKTLESLHFGLARVHDGQHRHEAAAHNLNQANSLKRTIHLNCGRSYDTKKIDRHIDCTVKLFTPEYFERVGGFGVESQRPVFVVGLPRSGTTLIESILASHPQVFGAGELPDIANLFHSLPKITGIDAKRLEHELPLNQETVERMAHYYLGRLERLDGQSQRIIDKMPGNGVFLGLIATLLPKAKIIYVRRDLRDTALSCWMATFNNLVWACDKKWLGSYFGNYLRVMEHWQEALPIPILNVDYEKVVEDTEVQARRMIDWIDLKWDSQCLAFHEQERSVKTASWRQIREPIHSRSVERWRNYEEYLADLFEELPKQP